MTAWNFADVWETVARERADLAAIDQGPLHLSWGALDKRADALAAAFIEAGLGQQARVAQYLYNEPAYLESLFAAFKAGMVPVNTNYRYGAEELRYLWADADAEAVIFGHAFVDLVDEVRPHLPGVRLWIQAGGSSVPPWARSYEDLVSAAVSGPVRGPWGRSGDDHLFVYTGGTTGMPKGVMWRQDDLWVILNRHGELRYPEDAGVEGVEATLRAPSRHPRPRILPGPPLMHGTALFTAMSVMTSGGSVVMGTERSFDAAAALDLVEAERVTQMTIVGDAFARPLLAELDASPDQRDLSSLWLMVSSGVMWSAPIKAGLARHLPKLVMVDALGSSEAIGIGRSQSGAGSLSATGGFKLGDSTRVINEDGTDVEAGSGIQGLLAVRGRGPSGYHKDPVKSAATFRVIDGERWTVAGDWATVDRDGTLTLLGRGSVCINTGGEKVFPEEVEEALKTHRGVADSIVVGIPDERFGERVVALVELSAGGGGGGGGGVEAGAGAGVAEEELIGWVKERLASYKAPRRVITVPSIARAANGKVDYRGWRERAIALLA